MREAEQWQRQYKEARARSEALAEELAAAKAELERVSREQEESEQSRQALSEELQRLEAKQENLREHNAELQARERELAEIQERMSDMWFESALSRARRHSTSPEEPSAVSPRSEQGGTP